MNRLIVWAKARCLLVMVALTWSSMIAFCAAIQLPLTIAALFGKRQAVMDACYSLWMIQDQHTGTILSGHHETTVSAMIGHYSLQGSKTANAMRTIVDALWRWVFKQPNHCITAIEAHDTFRFNGLHAVLGFVLYWTNLFFIVYWVL
jgi:hypothetical protein